MNAELSKIYAIIGHTFRDPALPAMALTHASASVNATYERLEFLGDRVLGLVVAQILYEKFPDEAEGALARRLAALVQGRTLADVAREIGLGDFISLSESERNAGGGDNEHILADVMEALLGALYLDAGLGACHAMIEKLWGERFYRMEEPPTHPKTALQEWAQAKGLALPQYKISNQSGPDHAPVFEISLFVGGYEAIKAEGRSRQEAEKRAARLFMEQHG
jgi:ribonuclease-3